MTTALGYGDVEGILERHNEVIRSTHGPTILQTMQKALVEAWIAHDSLTASTERQRVARGRIRGLAQAITIVRSPYSYVDPGSQAMIGRAIKREEDEAHAVARRHGA